MTFLPIVERELRVASRRRSTYLGRLTGAVVAMAVGGWIMLAMQQSPSNQLGAVLFVALSVLLFIYSVGAGARITADCLSEEKREGTLGLLFLTDLKGYDIVSGKLVANSLNTFYGLLSAFPVLAVSLLMGGVTSNEFWKVSLVATNLLFFSLATGMFASSVCRDERKSATLTFFLLFLFLGTTPLIELGLHIANNNRNAGTGLFILSPAFACFGAFGQRVGMNAREFWTSVSVTHLYGWLLLALASFIVPRSWQDKTTRAPLSFRNLWRLIFQTNRTRENQLRTKLLDINPFLWLTARDSLKNIFVWVAVLLLTALWFWGFFTWPKDWKSIPVYVMTALAAHTILKFWLASEACNRFVQDRKSGALELLLSTPLSVKEILRGQQLALFRQFAGPAVYILIIDLAFLFSGLQDRDLGSSSEHTFWVMMWLAGIIVFIMDLFALSWVSMWMGMTSPKINRASGAAISRILVLPWAAFAMSLTFWATISVLGRIGWDEHVVLIYWFGLCVANNLIFINWAKKNLHNRFRDIATQRFDPKSSRFAWLKLNPGQPAQALPPLINVR
jgi:ABC-type transport system involved in cytochrome c biogenesis permease component